MLTTFLREWLGAWPAPGDGLVVVGDPARTRPRWDGGEQPALAVTDATGRGVLSVAPDLVPKVRALLVGLDGADPQAVLGARLPEVLGLPRYTWFTGVFRWTTAPTPAAGLPDTGRWEPADGPDLPDWLLPFGRALVARDPATGDYLAGVGLKPHHASGVEISVGTEPAARGRGLARRLVARAAREIIVVGAVPLYLHDPGNTASARVADAAGFPDVGWHVHALGAHPA